ncbi:MAG: TlpA family protein disulfide reductase [Chloroflexi bacterium]|nr:TlpA family protein disulfide reductase [Chloroflexota bacterium]
MAEEQTHQSDAPQAELPEWLRGLEQKLENKGEQPAGQVQQRISPLGAIAILLVGGLLLMIGYTLIQRNKGTVSDGPAPNFTVTMYDFDQLAMPGEKVSLKDMRGNVVIVNFWASYCIPCRDEAPMFETVWREYQDQGVIMLGLNINDPLTNAEDYLKEFGITYPNAPDLGGKISNDEYRITGIPETFVIDPKGDIVRHFISTPSERDLRSEIERALES